MTVLDDRTERLLQLRLPRDYQALQRQYTVRYDSEKRLLRLSDIGLPDGWDPRTTWVQIKLPPHFPASAPRWLFPGDLRYESRIPRHLLTKGNWLVRGTLGDPFIYWPPHWDPDRSTVTAETDRALSELTAVDGSRTRRSDNA